MLILGTKAEFFPFSKVQNQQAHNDFAEIILDLILYISPSIKPTQNCCAMLKTFKREPTIYSY